MDSSTLEEGLDLIWSKKYSASEDKIIKPLLGLEIEIENGETVEVRITDGLLLMREILEKASLNEENGKESENGGATK